MEYLDSKNDMEIFSLIQRGNVCTMIRAGMGPLGCGEMGNHTAVRLNSSLASFLTKSVLKISPSQMEGKKGSLPNPGGAGGPMCTCLFMIQFLFHPVSLSQNHLQALSLSTHDFTSSLPSTPVLPLLLFQLVQQLNLLLLHPIHQGSCSLEVSFCLCDILEQKKSPGHKS